MTPGPVWTDAVIDYEDDLVAVIRHDARDLPLEDETVDLIVTSPPYFALRSYRDDGEHYDGQIGSEDTPGQFLEALDECMVEWGRVLKASGSIWINLGHKYAGSGGHNNDGIGAKSTLVGNGHAGGVGKAGPNKIKATRRSAPDRYNKSTDIGGKGGRQMVPDRTAAVEGIRTKSLMGWAWRFAIRQIDAGWILRAEVIWDKPNGLPESVTDRVRRSHETWFHFVKEPRYFSGIDEIREPTADIGYTEKVNTRLPPLEGSHGASGEDGHGMRMDTVYNNPLGRLPGSVWTIPSEPLIIPDDTRTLLDLPDHFAAFPQEWPRRIILGWSPTGICTECGEGRRPETSSEYVVARNRPGNGEIVRNRPLRSDASSSTEGTKFNETVLDKDVTIVGYVCACPTPDAPTTPAVILDPMGGTGTVAGVARMLGRYGISNDLSEDYNRLAIWRITQSGHFTKTEQRTWADRQGSML